MCFQFSNTQELDASKVLDKRTRSKNQVDTAQPSKKKMAIKKLRQESLAAEEEKEVATSLVTREILKQKVKEATVQKALDLAAQISVPADVLLKKTTGEATQTVLGLSEDLQQLVASGELLKDPEDKSTGSEAAISEAAASRGIPDVSNSANIIEIESGTSTPTSSATHTSDSYDLDDVPLSLIYKDISPSTKPIQKANTQPFEPVYLAVLKSIGEMSQKRVDICNKLPADHPFQPPTIEPLNVAPADIHTSTSTHSNQPSKSQPKIT